MARADDYAAKQAERVARLPVLDDPRSAVEILEEIRREIEKPELPPEPVLAADVLRGAAGPYRAKVAQPSNRHVIVTVDHPATCIDIDTPDSPQPVASEVLRSSRNSLDHARTLHARQALEQALDHGTALLAALGMPRLVDAGFWAIDPETAGAALADAVAVLDAIDPDPDLEPSLGAPERHPSGWGRLDTVDTSDRQSQAFWSDGGDPDGDREDDDPAEKNGDDELDLGWSALHSQLALGDNTADGDLTAPERAGRGFVRCAPDDHEDGHDAEGLNDEGGDEAEEIGIHPGLVRGRPLTRAERAALRGLARRALAMREAAHV